MTLAALCKMEKRAGSSIYKSNEEASISNSDGKEEASGKRYSPRKREKLGTTADLCCVYYSSRLPVIKELTDVVAALNDAPFPWLSMVIEHLVTGTIMINMRIHINGIKHSLFLVREVHILEALKGVKPL
ncbi:hypothetical protein CDL15_Pgr023938 [Punica granatum]|uniref:Uncharacterized protein n=1 Tax=Punica granatum TaxID=22663 RepID=A0A218XXT0_PUNGR|nr:hypothetical protein CDL15_Pgr023938 [Punica granatum]